LRKLSIDFRPGRRSSPWASRALLAAAVAVVLDAGLDYHDAQRAIARHEALLARTQPPGVAKASEEGGACARETVQRLSTPWSELFGALEGATSEQVAILAVEPDPKNGKVTISGEGKDYLAALTYVLELSRSKALSGVQLVRHETRPEDPQHAV